MTNRHQALFVTALKLEADAILVHLAERDRRYGRDGTLYRTGWWPGTRCTWSVSVVEAGMGNENAATATATAIYEMQPEIAIFSGIAGRLKEVNIGDVVVATQVVGFEYGKEDSGFLPRAEVFLSSFRLIQLAQSVRDEESWKISAGDTARNARAIIGTVASGSKVVANSQSPSAKRLRSLYSKALAVEMEGLGFLDATYRTATPSIVVRAISDALDGKSASDASGSQELAARHSASFCLELLRLVQPDSGGMPLQADEQAGDPSRTGGVSFSSTREVPVHESSVEPTVVVSGSFSALPDRQTEEGKIGAVSDLSVTVAGEFEHDPQSPVKLIMGSLGMRATFDLASRRVLEYHGYKVKPSQLFKLQGRDPRDAHFVVSRIAKSATVSTVGSYAQNMAFGIQPPPLSEYIANLSEAAEYMFEHNIFQENLVAVDFCEKMVAETNPGVLEKANRTESPHASAHGYSSIGDIMRSLNPFSGEFYREALAVGRWTREMVVVLEGRSRDLIPSHLGGDGEPAIIRGITEYHLRLIRYAEFMKRVVPLHDDLFDFFYEAIPGYEEVGRRRIATACWGAFQDPNVCNYRYRDMTHWGRSMGVTPGIIVDGDLVTNDLGAINLGIRLIPGMGLDRSSTDASGGEGREQLVVTDPLGYPVHRDHPWNRGSASPEGLTPRWFDGQNFLALETGPLARLWSTARSGLVDLGHVKATGSAVEFHLPKTPLKPAADFTWIVPNWANAIERHRARTYFQLYACCCALYFIDRALDTARAKTTRVWQSYEVPDDALGCGFAESPRGATSNHIVIRDGKIANFAVLSPTEWNENDRDQYDHPSPSEEAVLRTPIFEENPRDTFKGIDIVRAIRSFDHDIVERARS